MNYNYYAAPGIKQELIENKLRCTPGEIIGEVCNHFNYERNCVMYTKKSTKYANARFIAFSLMLKYTPLCKLAISQYFNLDHTTVLHGLNRIQEMIDTNDAVIDDYKDIEFNLKYKLKT